MDATAERRHLLDLDAEELAHWLQGVGRPAFHAAQIMKWVYERHCSDFADMTDLAQALRSQLAEAFVILAGEAVEQVGSEGGTAKTLLRWPDGASTETVMIPAEDGGGTRRTVCLSTQVGCDVGCRFCASGIGGARRNLTVGEVMEQALRVSGQLQDRGERLSHVVFMGMGEPLANYQATVEAVRRINGLLGIGRRRVTVSTVGLPKQMTALAEEDMQATLALSLHAPTAKLRASLIPWAEAIDFEAILEACRRYFERTGREVTLEYCLLAGVNDQPEHAEELATIAKNLRAHVNLMMYNPVAGLGFERPSRNRAIGFLKDLRERGARSHLRHSRGLEAEAACGQLRRRHEHAGSTA